MGWVGGRVRRCIAVVFIVDYIWGVRNGKKMRFTNIKIVYVPS